MLLGKRKEIKELSYRTKSKQFYNGKMMLHKLRHLSKYNNDELTKRDVILAELDNIADHWDCFLKDIEYECREMSDNKYKLKARNKSGKYAEVLIEIDK